MADTSQETHMLQKEPAATLMEEDDDEMEMEIDETVPNTPIIENKRNSDEFMALQPPAESPSTNPTPVPVIFTPSALPKPNSSPLEASKSLPNDNDDDVEIIDVTTPRRRILKPHRMQSKQAVDDDDVVCIDDKAEPNPNAKKTRGRQRRRAATEVKACEVIDLVDGKKGSMNSKCINYSCKSGVNLGPTPELCLVYYRVKNSEKKRREVCQECLNAALEHYDTLMGVLSQGKMLTEVDIPIRNDLVEIVSDSDDEVNEDELFENFGDAEMKMLSERFEQCMKDTLAAHKFSEQEDCMIKCLQNKGASVKQKYLEVDTSLHSVRKMLDGIHKDLYGEFKVQYEMLDSLDIPDMYPPTINEVVRTASVGSNLDERRSPRKTKNISYVELDDPGSSSSPMVIDGGLKENRDPSIESIDIPPVPADLPPKGPLQKPPLKLGDMYYAVRFLTMGSWIRVRLTSIVKPGSIVNGQAISNTMYCVTTECKQNVKYPTNRLVSGKELAYYFPSPVLLDVGTRVIAVFREPPTPGETKKYKKESFYPGIVAEPCSYTNRFRYLIFFDDGYAQYVNHKMVHLIYEASKDVWDDMHVDSRLFIKKYLESYPERPMVKLRVDQSVRTEYNGKWWLTRVTNIDCSLVQMFFEASSRIEWIYRGSTRLNTMYKEELAASNRYNKGRLPRKFNETGPYVQYTRNESSMQRQQQPPAEPMRAVARKSTSRPIIPPGKMQQRTLPFLPLSNYNSSVNVYTPPPSKVVVSSMFYFTPRAQLNTKSICRPHTCSPRCMSLISYDINKLKGYNPLSKPLLCGWNRITIKQSGNKREINYKAPCGRMIRTIQELHMYLRMTKSEMTVDLFDFDFWVHCLAEFVLVRNSTVNKDMSMGLENVTIPVVNYVDNQINEFCNYSIKREPMEGVHMNLDPEFLCGCDCEDDCQDKLKCQCWQLTLQGLPYLTKTASPEFIGYTYRRLPEPVTTGIYECNSKCKCAKTCLNRVVQNPLHLKLQVFKTNNRGWGIRCLNDIPQGAFICIYAGSILTEQMANEGGKNYGDEYLAELDYIEVVEKMKEDYEEEAIEEEDQKSKEAKSREESGDEDEEQAVTTRGARKKSMEEDTDFMPTSHVPKTSYSTYKTRLRKRDPKTDVKNGGGKTVVEVKTEVVDNGGKPAAPKLYEDECITLSDDEEVREPSSFNPRDETNLDDSRPPQYKSVREMFAVDECIYVMDAKVTGNIGRFLNHSCSPNVFVQNVFVDTHDLRFPWVAFFALTYIRAGTELTWNYNYDVGSVPGKTMYCHCSSQECRGRLL